MVEIVFTPKSIGVNYTQSVLDNCLWCIQRVEGVVERDGCLMNNIR